MQHTKSVDEMGENTPIVTIFARYNSHILRVNTEVEYYMLVGSLLFFVSLWTKIVKMVNIILLIFGGAFGAFMKLPLLMQMVL